MIKNRNLFDFDLIINLKSNQFLLNLIKFNKISKQKQSIPIKFVKLNHFFIFNSSEYKI